MMSPRPLVKLRSKFPDTDRTTFYRWRKDPKFNFPPAAKIVNGVEYFWEDELDAWQPPNGRQRQIDTKARLHDPAKKKRGLGRPRVTKAAAAENTAA